MLGIVTSVVEGVGRRLHRLILARAPSLSQTSFKQDAVMKTSP